MFKTTTRNIFSAFRLLALVVVFFSTFLFFSGKAEAYFTPAKKSPSTARIGEKPVLSRSDSELKKTALAAKFVQKKPLLAATLPFTNLTFQPQKNVWQVLSPGYYFSSQNPHNLFYTLRLPGISFLYRFLTSAIQPNAP